MSTSPLNHHLYVAIPQHYRYFAQGILATSPFAQQRNWPLKSLPIGIKAWFPYDRPDRPDRPSRLNKCSDDRDDHMETLPRRSRTIRTTETTSIAWIELSSIRTIGAIV